MRKSASLLLVVLVAFVCEGCGDGSVPAATSMPRPHGGTTLRLPDDLGYAELVNEPEPTGAREGDKTALVVYFLSPDGTTAMSPAPSEVTAKVELAVSRKNSQQTLELKKEPRSDDPAGSSRFASALGSYNLGSMRGQLTGNAGSKPFVLTIAGGR